MDIIEFHEEQLRNDISDTTAIILWSHLFELGWFMNIFFHQINFI